MARHGRSKCLKEPTLFIYYRRKGDEVVSAAFHQLHQLVCRCHFQIPQRNIRNPLSRQMQVVYMQWLIHADVDIKIIPPIHVKLCYATNVAFELPPFLATKFFHQSRLGFCNYRNAVIVRKEGHDHLIVLARRLRWRRTRSLGGIFGIPIFAISSNRTKHVGGEWIVPVERRIIFRRSDEIVFVGEYQSSGYPRWRRSSHSFI